MIRILNTYEPVTTIYRDLLPALAARGLKVEVVVSATEYREGRGSLEAALDHPNVEVVRIPSGLSVARGRAAKLWVIVTYVIGAALRSLLGPRAAITLFLTQPPLFSLWGLVLRALRNGRYGTLVMDLYPDVAIRDGLLDPDGSVARVLLALSRQSLRSADPVIVIGRCMAQRLLERGVSPDRIHVVHNWADERKICAVARDLNRLRAEWGLGDRFTIMYSGNMGTSHRFDEILEVAARLRDRDDIRFVFVGGGVRRREIERAIAERELTNVLLLPFQPLDRLGESLSVGDVHYISLREGFEGLVVPSKAYGVLAAGRPIIYQGGLDAEIGLMVAEESIGVQLAPGDVDGLEQAVLTYARDQARLQAEGERARALATGHYGRATAIDRYAETLSPNRSQSPETTLP